MSYLGTLFGGLITVLFVILLISTIGYLLGGIKIKGISLGTAGVLLAALLFGVLAYYVNSFSIGGATINLWNKDTIKPIYSFVSNLGTSLFVSAVGLIAGKKFFRTFSKNTISYVYLGLIIIIIGFAVFAATVLTGVEPGMAIGLLTGALTSTPGLASAKEAFASSEAQVTAGYGIAYIFGVLGVVLFVQIIPKVLKIDIEKERQSLIVNEISESKLTGRKLYQIDSFGFFPFFFTAFAGMVLGAIKIPVINFSLGSSGGALIIGLIIGHFGHICGIDMRVPKQTVNVFRELGLMLFLIGAGVPAGVNFITNFKPIYFIYGIAMTTIPMVVGYFVAKYVFKLNIFNNLGSITGGMTSTPALGTLISVAGTDDVASSYAATYPIALVAIVILSKVAGLVFGG